MPQLRNLSPRFRTGMYVRFPSVIQGSYIAGDREVVYYTKCDHCTNLAQCKKRRAPMSDCDTVGRVEFLVNDVSKVSWSGVILLKQIQRIVRDHLENDPPPDVAMPPVQMELGL